MFRQMKKRSEEATRRRISRNVALTAGFNQLNQVLGDSLDEYNMSNTNQMNLVFFDDAVEVRRYRFNAWERTWRQNMIAVSQNFGGE